MNWRAEEKESVRKGENEAGKEGGVQQKKQDFWKKSRI